MGLERINKTIEDVLAGLAAGKKESKQIIYEAVLEELSLEEKKHIQPYSFKKNILTLQVSSPAWMYTLNLKKNRLLKTLQQKAGEKEIKEIKLKIGVIK